MKKYMEFENSDGKRVRLRVMGEREAIELNTLKFAQAWKSHETRVIRVEKDGTETNEIIIIRA